MEGDLDPQQSSVKHNTRVAHLRNISPIVTQTDLVQLCSRFGLVTDVLLLHGKKQALVQFETEADCSRFINEFDGMALHLQTHPIYVQPSLHNTIQKEKTSTEYDKVSPVLLVSVVKPLYEITLDNLNRIFAPYEPTMPGSVRKIILFSKDAGFQALVQFSTVAAAMHAKNDLNGKNIYAHSCTLHIQFSTITDLNITINSDKAHDYTCYKPTKLPSYPSSYLTPLTGLGGFIVPPPGHLIGGDEKLVLIVSGFPEDTVGCHELFNLFSNYGIIHRIKLLRDKPGTALIQFASASQASDAQTALNGTPLLGNVLQIHFSKYQTVLLTNTLPATESGRLLEFDNTELKRTRSIWSGIVGPKFVATPTEYLHLSNFPGSTSLDQIVSFVSKVVEPVKVQLLSKGNKGMAIVQLPSIEASNNVMALLHEALLGDRPVNISYTRSRL
ncbi:putative Polypyrimidine tract-binding protein [Blattamonas nauphoetae]|uniref:Polypyrimidine tract-binding protein n=1 Tax=Blattamonas nauphoetae TaxID=2049346 RepID=A0ABQ9X7U9_9EUKA|nr:putative Polypyrimidine tract-binding protein [Blattamonas nauphoetae]